MLQIVSRPEVRASRLWAPASVHPSSLYGLALIYSLGSQGCIVILLVLCSVIFSQFILLIMVKSTVQSVAVGDSVIVKDSSGFNSGKVTSVSSTVVEITLADFNDNSGDSGAVLEKVSDLDLLLVCMELKVSDLIREKSNSYFTFCNPGCYST